MQLEEIIIGNVINLFTGEEIGCEIESEPSSKSRLGLIYFKSGKAIPRNKLYELGSEDPEFCLEKNLLEARRDLLEKREASISALEASVNARYLEDMRTIRGMRRDLLLFK